MFKFLIGFLIALASVVSFAAGAGVVGLSKTVASTAVPESLTASIVYATSVIVQAKPGNTQPLTVGSATVQAVSLSPGASMSIDPSEGYVSLKDIFVDVQVNGEGVNVTYLTRTE